MLEIYVNPVHFLKHLVPKLDSYLQDTPDLLRQLEEMKTQRLPATRFPVSIDVVGLYSNIPHDEQENLANPDL